MSINRKILVVSADPGGANNLVPVLKELEDDAAVSIEIFAYSQAVNIYSNAGFIVNDINSLSIDIGQLINEISPDLLLTSTSVDEINWELKFIEFANLNNIKSISLLDFWSNYRMRFEKTDGELVLPTRIAVMDESSKMDMLKQGFDVGQISIVGHPGYEALFDKYDMFDCRPNLGDDNVLRIMFVSQPIAAFYSLSKSNKLYLGFNEKTVFNDLLRLSGSLLLETYNRVELNILLHPKQQDEIDLSAISSIENVTIKQIENEVRYQKLQDMDIVIGMYSSFLLEAYFLGAVTLSYQPERRHIAYERSPLSEFDVVTDYNQLSTRLQNLSSRSVNLVGNQFKGSTKKMIELCHFI